MNLGTRGVESVPLYTDADDFLTCCCKDYTYVSLSVWDTKTQFDAARSAELPNVAWLMHHVISIELCQVVSIYHCSRKVFRRKQM